MPYDNILADKIRTELSSHPELKVEEKKMFRGLTFMVNGKMCLSVSGKNLMCRYNPALVEEIAERKGFRAMFMRGREYRGYCYVEPAGFKLQKHFEFWVNLCLEFNEEAKASGRKR